MNEKLFEERAKAINWWRTLSNETLINLTKRFYVDRNWYSLTGREIQHIWENLGKPKIVLS